MIYRRVTLQVAQNKRSPEKQGEIVRRGGGRVSGLRVKLSRKHSKTRHSNPGKCCFFFSVADCDSCCEFTRDHPSQGFYKNLEKFYKRMYKQAKIRAQEVEG